MSLPGGTQVPAGLDRRCSTGRHPDRRPAFRGAAVIYPHEEDVQARTHTIGWPALSLSGGDQRAVRGEGCERVLGDGPEQRPSTLHIALEAPAK